MAWVRNSEHIVWDCFFVPVGSGLVDGARGDESWGRARWGPAWVFFLRGEGRGDLAGSIAEYILMMVENRSQHKYQIILREFVLVTLPSSFPCPRAE